ncbi:MAG: hypothetical protein JWO06_2577 [Bacteroidota bacterium]|nr:hypothetical protein [Bacteroidota bacterium]
MNKKLFILLTSFVLGICSLSAQQIIFCNDVDEHDGQCKPESPSGEWKMSGGPVSFFALIKFPDGANYRKLLMKIYRNGAKDKPFFEDDITFDKGTKCLRQNLVFNKKGDYNVQITDDDGKVLMEGNLVIKGNKGMD